MSDNSILKYDPQTNTITFGNISDIGLKSIIENISDSIKYFARMPLEILEYNNQLNRILKFITEAKKIGYEISEFEFGDLKIKFIKEIIDSVEIDSKNDIFKLWIKLLKNYNNKSERIKEQCLEYKNILKNLNSVDIKVLNIIYLSNEKILHLQDYTKISFFPVFEKLAKEGHIAMTSSNGGPAIGTIPVNNFNQIGVYLYFENIKNEKHLYNLFLNYSTYEFVKFMNDNSQEETKIESS